MGRTSLLKVTSWPNAAREKTSRQQNAVPIERMIALLDNVSCGNCGRQYTPSPGRAGCVRRRLFSPPRVRPLASDCRGHHDGFTHERMISRAYHDSLFMSRAPRLLVRAEHL